MKILLPRKPVLISYRKMQERLDEIKAISLKYGPRGWCAYWSPDEPVMQALQSRGLISMELRGIVIHTTKVVGPVDQ